MSVWDNERIPFGIGDVLALPDHPSPREHLTRYQLAAARLVKTASVLDLGCGVGYGAYMMAQAGASHVLAIDADAETIAYAQSVFRHPRIQYIHANIQEAGAIVPAATYDMVTAFEIMEHLDDPSQLVSLAAYALTPRGSFMCSCPVIPTKAKNPFHKHDFTPREARDLVRTQFRIMETWIQNEWIQVLCCHLLGNGVNPDQWPDEEIVHESDGVADADEV